MDDYPRFFVRDEGRDVQKIAKAETPDEAAEYTPERGWTEYGALLSGRRADRDVDIDHSPLEGDDAHGR